jgi:hypothetical protein
MTLCLVTHGWPMSNASCALRPEFWTRRRRGAIATFIVEPHNVIRGGTGGGRVELLDAEQFDAGLLDDEAAPVTA